MSVLLIFSFSTLEGKHLELVEVAGSCKKLREVLKDFNFSDLPHTEKSTAYSVARDPRGYSEMPAVDEEKAKKRRKSNIVCKAGPNKRGMECGKSMSHWSSYKTHLRDFHPANQWNWPKKAKRPTLTNKATHDGEDEGEPEKVTCYLCNPHKEVGAGANTRTNTTCRVGNSW